MITIAKASAGSGKTYTLARTYIALLLQAYDQDPWPYRHILAVTFTNKATGEMKARILKELDILAHDPASSDYYHDFVPAICSSADQLRDRCSRLLKSILHDYSAFSIYTIDRFFQQILRSFARELGQFESYQLELDKSQIVNESVDRLLDALSGDNAELVEWLKDSAMKQIASKGYFQINETLYAAAADLQNPHFVKWLSDHGIKDPSTEFSKSVIRDFRDSCDRLVAEFKKCVKDTAKRMMDAYSVAGIDIKDCQKGTYNVVKDYSRLSSRSDIKAPTAPFCKKIADPEKMLLKAYASKADALPADYVQTASALISLFYKLEDDSIAGPSEYFKAYRTALQVRDISYGLGVCGELYESFSNLLKDKNVLCLEDSNSLLGRIVDGSDVPFIYEKTGVRYEHFLLDEFQDTSLIQWNNFLPLLRESNANGNDNLIVGDVKQSIYRWRDSDWNLLNSEVGKAFPDSREMLDENGRPKLSVNFRTEENIVKFNNSFFSFLTNKVAETFQGEQQRMMKGIYADVCQTAHCKGGLGEVRICFHSAGRKEDGKVDAILQKTVQMVSELHDEKGVGYGEIAIVIRNNAPGEKIADALLAQGVPVISDDSLSVNNSIVVRKIVSVLASVENPKNQASGYLARSIGFVPGKGESSLLSLTEEIIRALKCKDAKLVDAHTTYIQAFVDWMQNWTSNNGNRLKDFLKAWAESNQDYKSVKIASPATEDAVRVITIHKSKGLEFPYVIIPYVNDIDFFKQTDLWAEPQVPAGLNGKSELDKAVNAFDETVKGKIFKPRISSGSVETYFESALLDERFAQAIDALNLLYVALTRPKRGLYIIAGKISKNYSDSGAISNSADALMAYLTEGADHNSLKQREMNGFEEFLFGSFCNAADIDNARPRKKSVYRKIVTTSELDSSYPSFPMDAGRLRIDKDASDFFIKEDVDSNRLRGIVLHNILSSVVVPGDLEAAIASALENGDLSAKEAVEASRLLEKRIASAVERGWFSDNAEVLNERGIVTEEGEELRPDRVEITSSGVCIIDYKFGNPKPEYTDQVRSYAEVYRKMGYTQVQAFLWFVYRDVVEQVV